jgi:hypothetical protein
MLKRKITADDGQSYATAFAIGAFHQDPKLHRDRLSPPPRFWHKLLRHPHREGFVKAAQTEFEALDRKEAFQVMAKDDISKKSDILPLTWIFDYKFDHNGYLARYKARICVRGDL